MEDESSVFWRIALLVSVCALAAVSYCKYEGFRGLVDDKCPWVKEQLNKRGIKIEKTFAQTAAPASGDPATAAAAPSGAQSAPPAAAAPVVPITFEEIAANPARWPKMVKIKKAIVFPAILDGKEVGKVNLPAGSEVKLARIENGKVGLTHCGGGAWTAVADTDLVERAQAHR